MFPEKDDVVSWLPSTPEESEYAELYGNHEWRVMSVTDVQVGLTKVSNGQLCMLVVGRNQIIDEFEDADDGGFVIEFTPDWSVDDEDN